MNKRQRKKNQRKQEMFIASYALSYKDLKRLDKWYHEYVVNSKRHEKRLIELGVSLDDWDDWSEYFDSTNLWIL